MPVSLNPDTLGIPECWAICHLRLENARKSKRRTLEVKGRARINASARLPVPRTARPDEWNAMSPKFLRAAPVVVLLVATSLSGCSAPAVGTPSLLETWAMELDDTAVVVAVDGRRAYLEIDRDFGEELMAVSLEDGSYAWSEISVPDGSWSLVGDTLLSAQKLGEGYVWSAFDGATGEQVWQRSFTDPPLVATREGTFVSENDGDLVLTDLAGIRAGDRWRPTDGCAMLSVAASPSGAGFYANESCPTGPVQLVQLDQNLKELNRLEVAGESFGFSESEIVGPYLVYTASSAGYGDGIAVIRDDRLIYRGSDLAVADYSLVGDDLAVLPGGGESSFLINSEGKRVVPRDASQFFVGSASVYPFAARLYTFFDPRTEKEIGSSFEARKSMGFSLLQSGTAAIERIEGAGTTIRRVELTRVEPISSEAGLVAAPASVTVDDTEYSLSTDDFLTSDILKYDVRAVDTSMRMQIFVARFGTSREADAAWMKWFDAKDETTEFKDETLVVDDYSTRVRSERCLAYLSGDPDNVEDRDKLDSVIFTQVVREGCSD